MGPRPRSGTVTGSLRVRFGSRPSLPFVIVFTISTVADSFRRLLMPLAFGCPPAPLVPMGNRTGAGCRPLVAALGWLLGSVFRSGIAAGQGDIFGRRRRPAGAAIMDNMIRFKLLLVLLPGYQFEAALVNPVTR